MIDAHIHLQDARFDADRSQLIETAMASGVCGFFCAATQPADWESVIRLSQTNNTVIPFIGTHPWYADSHDPDLLRKLLKQYPEAGVGEIGLDGLHGQAGQTEVFKDQLAAAHAFSRPCSIHCVKSFDILFPLLKQTKALPPALLFHAFGGTMRDAEFLSDYNAFFSFSGASLLSGRTRTHDVIRRIPPGRILAETDAPDMRPPPEFTTKPEEQRNLPANLPLIIKGLADIRGIPAEEMAALTACNARKFHKGLMS